LSVKYINALSWDESGGLYDHVPPAVAVKPDSISPVDLAGHNAADYTAVLKFIETRYNLPTLTNRDEAQIDMTEFFDFVNVPWRIPPTPPSQPITGMCDYGHLQ
jgi:phospholipase C